MEEYFKNLNEEVKEYLKILSPEFPEWLLEYINTPEMLRLDGVGMSCGTDYTKVYNDKYFYSMKDESDKIYYTFNGKRLILEVSDLELVFEKG